MRKGKNNNMTSLQKNSTQSRRGWFFHKIYRPERSDRIYLKWWREETYSQEYSVQQRLIQFMEEIKAHRQAKLRRIQHHQTSCMKSAKAAFLGRKHKQEKRTMKTNPKQLRK